MKIISISYFLLILSQYACKAHVFNEVPVQQYLCTDDSDCTRFAMGNAKVQCINGHCDCHYNPVDDINGCLSVEEKFRKTIGGFCPCNTPNSECKDSENICYCQDGYISDDEKQHCVKKSVKLNETCQWDFQCQNWNPFTFCDARSHICTCMDDFVNINGECISIAGSKRLRCNLNSECHLILGVNTHCYAKEFCVCKADYISSNHISKCLLNRYYDEDCSENNQCLAHLGTGSMCRNGRCVCDRGYYATRQNGNIICVRKKRRGQYCKRAEDCYELHLNVKEAAMTCRFAECDCQTGFHSLNDGICLPNFNTSSLIFQRNSYVKVLLSILLCISSKSIIL